MRINETHIQDDTRINLNSMGFSLIELLVVISIIGLLAAIAIPNYIRYREKAIIASATTELKIIEKKIYLFATENGRLPNSLDELDYPPGNDPWGNPYQYLRIDGGGPGTKGQSRKDHFMVPVNTDFDLYSMGRDGNSVAPFTAAASQDDIVRANNGGYMGPVSQY